MLRIARLTDYGLVLVTHIASQDRRVFSTRELAEATHLPLPTVSKVLKMLVQSGLLESHRGVAGGYSLGRSPDDISVADVVAAIEGPVALTLCSEGEGMCDLESWCPDRSNMQRVNEVILGALRQVKVAEMVRPRARVRFGAGDGGA